MVESIGYPYCANSTLIEFGTSMKPEIYKDEGYKFMAATFEVYNDRGYGLAEEIYQECLEIELALRGISFRAKAELKCFYKGLAPEHEAQLLNYMRIARQPVGYLVNFGHKGTLEWKRFILSDINQGREQPPTVSPGGISVH